MRWNLRTQKLRSECGLRSCLHHGQVQMLAQLLLLQNGVVMQTKRDDMCRSYFRVPCGALHMVGYLWTIKLFVDC